MRLTWEPPPPWRAAWRGDTSQLELHDPERRLRATLALVVADTPGTQLFGPIGRWVDEVPLRAWKSRHGGLLHGGLASILLPDGTVGEAWNGKQHGWRRTHRNGHVVLAGRRYAVRHLTRRRTLIERDGAAVVTMRRTGWRLPWQRHDSTAELRFRMRRERQVLDPVDELAIVVASTACGPAGRPGWWANLLSEFTP